MNLRMDAHDLTQLAELMRRAPAIVEDELVTAQTHATMLLQGELTRPPAQGGLPIGAGGASGLAGSVSTRVEIAGGEVIGWVETNAQHAPYVEFGTKPHWIGKDGIQALEDWALAKLPGVSTAKEARSAAFAIRHAIAKRGTKPNPVWQTTFRANVAGVRAIFQDALTRIVNRIEAAGVA